MSYKGFVEINIVKAENLNFMEKNMYFLIFDMQFYNFGMMTCLHLCVFDKPIFFKNSNVKQLLLTFRSLKDMIN